MIKGVNKQIIEINDIENEHFYKAIFFVRPESGSKSEVGLKKSADEYIMLASSELSSAPAGFLRITQKRKKRRLIISLAVAIIFAAVIGVILYII